MSLLCLSKAKKKNQQLTKIDGFKIKTNLTSMALTYLIPCLYLSLTFRRWISCMLCNCPSVESTLIIRSHNQTPSGWVIWDTV